MENTNAGRLIKNACGWCGNALLQRSGDYFPIQTRDGLTLRLYAYQERAQGGSIPLLCTTKIEKFQFTRRFCITFQSTG